MVTNDGQQAVRRKGNTNVAQAHGFSPLLCPCSISPPAQGPADEASAAPMERLSMINMKISLKTFKQKDVKHCQVFRKLQRICLMATSSFFCDFESTGVKP